MCTNARGPLAPLQEDPRPEDGGLHSTPDRMQVCVLGSVECQHHAENDPDPLAGPCAPLELWGFIVGDEISDGAVDAYLVRLSNHSRCRLDNDEFPLTNCLLLV